MDTRIEKLPPPALGGEREIHLRGFGEVRYADQDGSARDVVVFLKERKAAKLMAKQDRMALVAAARAVCAAGLTPKELSEETGIYFCVGTLPFEEGPLEVLSKNSEKDGKFDMERFSREAIPALNPLLTFQCLPNMPVFHISYHLGIHGPYFVTYPGEGEWFSALFTAISDLQAGRIRFALVGAVADQRNPLVRHQFAKRGRQDTETLLDSAAVLVLTLDQNRSLGKLSLSGLHYQAFDPFRERGQAEKVAAFGPVGAALAVCRAFQPPEPLSTAPLLGLRYELQGVAGTSACLEVSRS